MAARSGSTCMRCPGTGVHHEDATAAAGRAVRPGACGHAGVRRPARRASRARDRITVNSLHHQGVRTLASRLVEEARADDGLIEAFRVRDARRFALAVQWHPEWKPQENAFSTRIVQGIWRRRRASAPRKTKQVIHDERHPSVLSRTRHLRSRGHHSRHGRHCARQDHARAEVRRRRGHAAAGKHLPADRDGRLSGRYFRRR